MFRPKRTKWPGGGACAWSVWPREERENESNFKLGFFFGGLRWDGGERQMCKNKKTEGTLIRSEIIKEMDVPKRRNW